MTKDAQTALQDKDYKTLYRSMTVKCISQSNTIHRSSKSVEIAQKVFGRTIPKPNDTR